MRKEHLLALAVLLICALHPPVKVEDKPAAEKPQPATELSALSEEDKKLNFQTLLTAQPNFTADEKYFFWEGFGGFSIVTKIGVKGARYFSDTDIVRIVSDGKRVVRVSPKDKTIEDLKTYEYPRIELAKLGSDPDVRFNALGVLTVSGYAAIKVEVSRKDSSRQMFLYFAKELHYLVVASQDIHDKDHYETRQLFNIELNPADALFEIPTGYTEAKKH